MIKLPDAKFLSTIPKIFQTDDTALKEKEKVVYLHFNNDHTHWYIIEFDGLDLFYGYTIQTNDLRNSELGDIRFQELQIQNQDSAEISLDKEWTPIKAGSVDIIKKTFGW